MDEYNSEREVKLQELATRVAEWNREVSRKKDADQGFAKRIKQLEAEMIAISRDLENGGGTLFDEIGRPRPEVVPVDAEPAGYSSAVDLTGAEVIDEPLELGRDVQLTLAAGSARDGTGEERDAEEHESEEEK